MDRQLGILSHSEIRARAREYLKGYWLKLFIITLVAAVITGFFGLASLDIKFVTGKLWTDTPSIVVTHVSGYSWTGKAPVETDKPEEVPAYSLNDLIAGADEKQGFEQLSLCRYLPSGFWAVFAVSAVCSIISTMIGYGLRLNQRRCMKKQDPSIRALFKWKMLPKALAVDLIHGCIALPSSALTLLASDVFSLVLIPVLLLISTIVEYMLVMCHYFWTDNPALSVSAIIRESCTRMKGHKIRFFVFRLTFIGWQILVSVLSAVIGSVVILLDLPLVISFFVILPIGALYTIYQQMGEMVFFDNICHPEAYEASSEGDDDTDNVPEAGKGSVYARSADESVAWAMLSSHNYSHKQLMQDGLWEEYQALDVSPEVKVEWMKKYARFLCDEYATNPTLLNDILAFAGEYGDTFSMQRVMNVLTRAVDFETQPPQALAEQCAQVVSVINGETFAEHEKFVSDTKNRISDMADRLEVRLEKADPNGSWRETLALIRAGCAE